MKHCVLIFFFFLTQSLSSQELVFPQKVNPFRYSSSVSQHTLYGFPDFRLWGWSNNGKVAYSIEKWIEGRGGQIIHFIIFDSVNGNMVFDLKMDSYEQNDVTNESLYNIFKDTIFSAMKINNIIEQEISFNKFPISRNSIIYYSNIIDVKYKYGLMGFFDNIVVSKYSVQITTNNKRKIITTFIPINLLTRWVYVCGYFLSPFENRVLVITAEEHWGFEGTELTYRFSGCHLETGFD